MIPVTLVPEIVVETDGTPLPATGRGALAGLTVRARLDVPAVCELTFADPPGPLDDAARLRPGSRLRVSVADREPALFEGEVTAVERGYAADLSRTVRVRAYDLLHQLRNRQQVRAHDQVTARDVAAELAGPAGLTVEAADDGPFWERLIQHRQTDYDLLVQLTGRCGLHLAVRGDVLHLLTLDGIGDPVKLALGDSLLDVRVERNAVAACRSVTTAGWNPSRVEVHSGSASSPRLGRDGGVEPLGGGGERALVDELAEDDGHATALAQGLLDARAASEVVVRGTAEGDPALRPGARIELANVDGSLDGTYVLTEVVHTVDDRSGFVTEVSTELPRPAPRSRGSVATPGVVSAIDDPDGLGRVKATLPTYDGIETDWMTVVMAGAGAGKGLVTLPDVGDSVLVLLVEGDPGQGVVLGALYGMTAPPDTGIEGGAVRRFSLTTPGGQRIRLDDESNSVRVEDATGSYVELSPERVQVHAAVDLVLEAPGRAVTIRGASIDLERA